jgi:hypothetical protein
VSLIGAALDRGEEIQTPDGLWWRVRPMAPLLMRRSTRSTLVLTGAAIKLKDQQVTPPAEDAPPSEHYEYVQQVLMRLDEAGEDRGEAEAIQAAVFAECVTHARESADAPWRPVRLVAEGDAVEGDGEAAPDVIPYPKLRPDTARALYAAARTITMGGEARETLVASFRR